MLADIRYWENDATNKHYAIAHFNVWNAEMLMGVILDSWYEFINA